MTPVTAPEMTIDLTGAPVLDLRDRGDVASGPDEASAATSPIEAFALVGRPSAFLPPSRAAVPVAPTVKAPERRHGLRTLRPLVGSLTGYAGLLDEHWDELDDTVRRAIVSRIASGVVDLQDVTNRLVAEEDAAHQAR